MGSAASFAARPSPEEIYVGDIFVKNEEDGLDYRFDGTEIEFVLKWAKEELEHPKHARTALKLHISNFESQVFKRKPSLAILHLYNADLKLQNHNLKMNKEAISADLSNNNSTKTVSGNFDNKSGQNCSGALFDLYATPTKLQVRKLERCIAETYCAEEYEALKNVLQEESSHSEEYNTQLNSLSACTMKRKEFVHVQRAVDKLFVDEEI